MSLAAQAVRLVGLYLLTLFSLGFRLVKIGSDFLKFFYEFYGVLNECIFFFFFFLEMSAYLTEIWSQQGSVIPRKQQR